VGESGRSDTRGNGVQGTPQSFKDFTIYHTGPFDERCCIPEEASVLVAMDMKHADGLFKLNHREGNICLASSETLRHVLAVLAFNIVYVEDFANSMQAMCVFAGFG